MAKSTKGTEVPQTPTVGADQTMRAGLNSAQQQYQQIVSSGQANPVKRKRRNGNSNI